MNVLIDTNILTRSAEPGHSMHRMAVDAVINLRQQGHALFLTPQSLYEFWVVCTRPVSANGMGKTAPEAANELATVKKLFTILDDSPLVLQEWERLVIALHVMGKNAHDARLVASMLVNGLTHLLTFNEQDFKRFTQITVLSPANVAAQPSSP